MHTPTREQVYHLDDCAEWPVIIPQWTGPAGEQRGVRIRALTFRARMQAEAKATDKKGVVNPWLLVAYEVAAGLVQPAGVDADTILKWNADVVEYIHNQILQAGGLSGALVASELARLADGPPPPEPGGVASDADDDPDDLDGDAGPEAGSADS